MADTTSVPAPTFGPRGFIAPQESDILTGVIADMNAAFGGNMNPALETPQGQLASSMAAITGQANDTFVYYTQQVDPSYAEGRMQDGIARIYFLERQPAQPTTVQCDIIGLAGVVIPFGALAQSTDGNLYYATGSINIPAGGTISGEFACTTNGPIACPADSLTTIYRSIPGWDSINNPSDGVIGRDTESRADFEYRRQRSVFLNSQGSLPSILASVLQVTDIVDAYATENTSSGTVTIGGVTLAAHSLYVAAYGGTDADVADAIWRKKAPGCAYNGNTTITVYDSNSGYQLPYPSYQVTFERPAALPILFAVTIANNSSVPADAVTQIQNAIIDAFSGGDGGSRARIGGTIYASRYYAPVAALGSWVELVSILIGTATPTGNIVTAQIDQFPTIAAADISVTLV